MKIAERSQSGLSLLYTELVQQTQDLSWKNRTDAELTALLQECVQSDKRIAESYSILKEVIRRKTGLSLFDAQLMASFSMQQGHIAELPTGEGKTLAAVVTAVVFAMQKKPVHVLVFNDYLAQRDYHANLPIYEACGVTCGYIVESSDFAHRKAAYSRDVVYVSAKEAGFDYLRDFLCIDKRQLLLNTLSVALVDEADSILIDEARIPLVLAGNTDDHPSIAAQVCMVVAELTKHDVEVNPADNQVWLTDIGMDIIEEKMLCEDLYSSENAGILALIYAALEARFLLKKDKDYIVKDNTIWVVDEATGRVVQNRRFPDLLHQALEVQELGMQGVPSIVYNSMSIQAFLLQYNTLCGMTGTAASSVSEFRGMYEMEVDVIPPHIPCIRKDHPDAIFLEKGEQVAAILSCIRAAHSKGQPVLIGTQSVQESERFSALLAQQSIKHRVLNAKNDAEEAAIIADAGMPYQVTISTNMAGRGVDIRLGGSSGQQADFVCETGGLYVISTGINRSLRIDNQLRGRAGRQGDVGESQFFVCLSDLQLEIFFEIEFYKYKKYPKLLRRAQKIQEGRDAEARYMLERYSQIVEEKRKEVTDYRTELLLEKAPPRVMQDEAPALYHELIDRVGKKGVLIAERQLLLYFINMNWASYLAAMEDKRSGIHLMIIGKKNPLNEYYLFALSAFSEMVGDIKNDVIAHMKKCEITSNGIDMEEAGLSGATTTWTYMIDESASQFSRIPRMVKSMSNSIKGTLFTFRGIHQAIKKKLCGLWWKHV